MANVSYTIFLINHYLFQVTNNTEIVEEFSFFSAKCFELFEIVIQKVQLSEIEFVCNDYFTN